MKNLSDSFCFLIFFVSIFVTFSTISAVPVRLIYGDSQRGTVQVYYGTWFTVCDDSWDINDARVVCKTLGFYDAVSAYCCARFGRGGGYIVANLGCSGSESDLSQCSPSGFYTGGCGHHEDAGVVCRPHIVRARLVGGKTSTEGRVELYYNNLWGTVCDDSWDINDAKVVCRMLGYVAVRAVGNAYFGKGSGTIWMDGVRCSGSETNIEQCHFNGWGSHDCQHLEDAGVICRPYAAPQVPPLNVRASSTNSTTIVVKWDAILSNGTDTPIQSYRIYCRKVNTSVTVTSTTSASFRQAMFSSLDIYTNYEIQVAGINQNGEGARSIALIVRTDEEIPKAAPNVTSIINDNSTSLYVAWDPLSSGQILGKLLGYYIWYSPAPGSCSFLNNCSSANYTSCANATAAPNSNCSLSTNSTASANTTAAPDSKCSLSSEATGNSCSYAFNASAPHMNVTVEPDASQFVLRGLTKFTAYWVQIAVFNSKGVGPRSPAVRRCTDQDVPSAPPSNLRVLNQTSTSIEIAWDGIPVERMHGVLLGYRVAYGLLGIPGSNASLVQIDVAEPDTYQQTLTGLRKYSSYWITVTGFTSIGDGPVSEPVNATTDQHVPSVPPANVRAYSNSSNSLQVDWDQVPSALAHGVLLGYLVTYRKSGAGAVLRRQTALDRTGILLTGLQPYSVYDIHVCAFTVKGYGPQSGVVSVRTEQDVPSTYPSNVSVIMETSSSISIQWDPVSTPQIHGVLLGYHVTYGALKNSSVNVTCQTGPSSHQLVLSGLDAYTTYWVEVAAFTVKGPGPFSPPIMATTDQDVPSAAPSSMRTTNVTSTSLEVHWAPVPPQQARGVLLGYTVSFSSLNKTSHTKNVSPNSTQLVLRGLQAYTDYNITLSAFTNKGSGPQARLPVRTAEDVPDTSPNNLRVLNQTSSSIEIAWDGIPVDRVHGVLLGYRVAYGLLGIPGSNVSIVGPDTFQTTLTGLRKYSSYWITVTGFTSIGDGLASEAVNATTDQHVPSVPPSNVRTHVNGSTSIQVDWNPVPIVFIHGVLVGYLVSYRKRGTGAFVTNQSAPGTTSILLTGLQPYSVYDIHVSAFTIKGYGPRSGIVSVRTDQDVPSAWPPNARTTITTPSIIFLQWDPVPTPQIHGVLLGYHVTYGALKNSSVNVTRQTGPSSHQLVLSGLDAYTTYWMEVAAFTVKGPGPFSSPIMATTDQDVPSAAPGDIRATKVTSTSMTIKWDPVPSHEARGVLLGYTVSYNSLNQTSFTTDVLPNITGLALQGLKAFTVYHITVAAFTDKGRGPNARLTLKTDEDVPSARPTNLRILNQTSTSIIVAWDGIPVVRIHGVLQGYRVAYGLQESLVSSDAANISLVQRIKVGPDTSQHMITGLQKFSSYWITVTGYTSIGDGPASDLLNVTTDQDVPSSPPSNVSANVNGSTSIQVDWDKVPSALVHGILMGYLVTYRKSGTGVMAENETAPGTTSILLTGLQPYFLYDIQVSAFTVKGCGPQSGVVSVRTEQDVPSASPPNVRKTITTPSIIFLQWDPVPTPQIHGFLLGYHVTYGALKNSSVNVTHQTGPSSHQLVLSGLDAYTTYWMEVAAFTVKGSGPFSPPVMATTDQDVPSTAPGNMRTTNVTSTSVTLHWDPVPSRQTRGLLLGYAVSFASLNGSRSVIHAPPSSTELALRGLKAFTVYDITLVAFTTKGTGPVARIMIRTEEDVPSVAPTIIKAANQSSTSLTVQWSRIPPGLTRGVLLGYRVTYTQYDSGATYTRDTAAGVTRMTLTSLTPYMVYTVSVAGFTSKGTGPESYNVTLSTDEDVPSVAPFINHATNLSSTSILVQWTAIPTGHVRGVLLGYRVYFKSVHSTAYLSNQTGPSEVRVLLRGLDVYTGYTIQVAAFTAKGEGPRSTDVDVSTEEDVPIASPINVQAANQSSTSLRVRWGPVPEGRVHGVLLGYHVTYRQVNGSWFRSDVTKERELVLSGLQVYTVYSVRVAAYTRMGDGPASPEVIAHTDEGVPAVSPDVTRADNRSSTSILVQWRPVPPGLTQGVLLGYHVIYSESMNTTTVVSKRTKETSIVLSGLRKYTRYRVTVAAYTSRGDGVRSNATFVTTDQDVPSVAPSRLRTANITSSAISVTWDPIPAQRANGKLLGYRVTCNASSYHVTRNEASGSLRYTLSGLLSYTWYRIYVTGFTVKGDGPISEDLHVRTAENAPDLAPQNVRAVNQSSTSLLVTWDPLPAGHTRGELAGYRVWYRAVDDSDDERVVLVSSDRSDVIIRDLRLFTVYAVQVEAFTGKGTGPRSEPYRVLTDEGVPTAAPYNITTEPVNSTAVIIQWYGVSKEHLFGYFGGYHVTYRRLTYASCEVSVRTSGTQVVLGSLEPGVEYKVQVSASTGRGDGPWSEAVMFSTGGAIEYNTAAMVSNGSAAWQFVAPPVGVVLALIILVLVGGAVYWKRRNREPKEDRVKVSPRDDIELKEKDDKDPIAFKNPTYDDI